MSWCKLEVAASSAKAVCPPSPGSELFTRASPPLTVASLQLKTVINPASHQHEVCVHWGGGGGTIPAHTEAPMRLSFPHFLHTSPYPSPQVVAAGVVHLSSVDIEAPMSLRLPTLPSPSPPSPQVVAAGVVHLSSVDIEAPMSLDSWNRPAVLRNFTIVRKLDGQAWPPGKRGRGVAGRGRGSGGGRDVRLCAPLRPPLPSFHPLKSILRPHAVPL